MNENRYSGFCRKCGEIHSLPEGSARLHAEELFRTLDESGRIDFENPQQTDLFSTDYLFGEALGQMFGVLQCVDKDGNEVVLKAFSCQYNSCWEVPGWVPPALDVKTYKKIVIPADKKIKDLSRRIEAESGEGQYEKLKAERKQISQQLMKEIHSLYSLHNFRGEEKGLEDAFYSEKGIPTGTGDCCAPKLLNFAAQNGLKPTGISEFYFGKSNKSGTRQHGFFYSSCESKCEPILGFLMCGLQDE